MDGLGAIISNEPGKAGVDREDEVHDLHAKIGQLTLEQDQKTDHPKPPLKPSAPSGLTLIQDEPGPPLENRLNSPECFDDGHHTIQFGTRGAPMLLALG
jgi:hypothetical protein